MLEERQVSENVFSPEVHRYGAGPAHTARVVGVQ